MCLQQTFKTGEIVTRLNDCWQIVPQGRSSDSERAVSSFGTCTLHLYHVIVRRAQCSQRLIRAHEFTQIHWRVVLHGFISEYKQIEVNSGVALLLRGLRIINLAAVLCIRCRRAMLTAVECVTVVKPHMHYSICSKNGKLI